MNTPTQIDYAASVAREAETVLGLAPEQIGHYFNVLYDAYVASDGALDTAMLAVLTQYAKDQQARLDAMQAVVDAVEDFCDTAPFSVEATDLCATSERALDDMDPLDQEEQG